MLLVDLSILAVKLDAPELEELTLRELRQSCFGQPDFLRSQVMIVATVLANTPKMCGLQRFFAWFLGVCLQDKVVSPGDLRWDSFQSDVVNFVLLDPETLRELRITREGVSKDAKSQGPVERHGYVIHQSDRDWSLTPTQKNPGPRWRPQSDLINMSFSSLCSL